MHKQDCSIAIIGASPMLHNEMRERIPAFPIKRRGESYEDFERRAWTFKAITTEQLPSLPEGFTQAQEETQAKEQLNLGVAIKGIWIKSAIIESQKRTRNPIKPANSRSKNDSMMNFFISGLLFEDRYPILNKQNKPYKVSDTASQAEMVRPQGKGRILCMRPRIPLPWHVDIKYTIIDPMVKPEHVSESLTYIGIYMGIGDWRPQNKGEFGRFTIQ